MNSSMKKLSAVPLNGMKRSPLNALLLLDLFYELIALVTAAIGCAQPELFILRSGIELSLKS